jgi:very-short-patch-repair endonuclease
MSTAKAKALRSNMTEAERRLWYFLRALRFRGRKFKRQATIGKYIVDFVNFKRRLVIEVDDGQHSDNQADCLRTRWLENQGFRVPRFWNNEVLKNTVGVLDMIMTAIVALPLSGAPPSPIRGRGDSRANSHSTSWRCCQAARSDFTDLSEQ